MRQGNLEDFFNLRGRAVNSSSQNAEIHPIRDIPNQLELRLPHHTKALWRFLQPRLLELSTGMKDKPEDFLEILCDFVVETRLQTRRNLNVGGWVYFLELFVRYKSE